MSADIRTRALACLARRDYSRAELRRKLLGETADIDQLDSTLDALERDGFLSDARFAEHLVAQRAVDEAQLAVLSAQLRESELARARAVWQKKYGSAPKTPAERARQMRFLAMRGFEADTLHPLFKNNL